MHMLHQRDLRKKWKNQCGVVENMPVNILSGNLISGYLSLLMYSALPPTLALCLCVCLSLSLPCSLSLCLLSLPHFLAASSLFPPTHRCLFLMQNSFNLLYRLLPTHALKWISHYQTNKWLVGFFLQDKKKLTSSALTVLVKLKNQHLQRKLPEWFPLVPPNQGWSHIQKHF